MQPSQTSSNTIKLQINVPETIALSFATGREVQSQFGGDQLLFSTDCGRRLYLPPFVGQKIYDAGIEAHTPFEICKREVSHGNRRTVEYQITPLDAPTAAGATAAVSQIKQVSVTAAPVVTAPASKPITAHEDSAFTPPTPYATDEAMKRAGYAAVDAVLAIEAYARERGMQEFEFGADNIQRIAVSIYIDGGRNGRRS